MGEGRVIEWDVGILFGSYFGDLCIIMSISRVK